MNGGRPHTRPGSRRIADNTNVPAPASSEYRRPMPRTRISATVDATRLSTASALTGETGSALVDRALGALIERVEAEREAAALDRRPYEDDPELSWSAPLGPDLPYDGAVPDDVVALAAARRRTRDRYRAG